MTEQLGIRELRQQTSEVIRRASEGEEIVITVSGYPAARLSPLDARRWRSGRELAEVFATPIDSDWAGERADEAIDHAPSDPWERERP